MENESKQVSCAKAQKFSKVMLNFLICFFFYVEEENMTPKERIGASTNRMFVVLTHNKTFLEKRSVLKGTKMLDGWKEHIVKIYNYWMGQMEQYGFKSVKEFRAITDPYPKSHIDWSCKYRKRWVEEDKEKWNIDQATLVIFCRNLFTEDPKNKKVYMLNMEIVNSIYGSNG